MDCWKPYCSYFDYNYDGSDGWQAIASNSGCFIAYDLDIGLSNKGRQY